MNDVVLTSLLGLGTAAAGAFVTYLTTRRKYNAEVRVTEVDNHNKEIEHYGAMLDFYQKLLDDESKRIDEIMKENENLRKAARLLREECLKMRTAMEDKTQGDGQQD